MTNLINLSADLLAKLQRRADELNLTIEMLVERLLHDTTTGDHSIYRQIVHAANDAIFLTTSDGVFLEVNQAALDLLGYTLEELQGMRSVEIYDDPDVRPKMLQLLETTGIKDFPYTLVHKSGRRIYCAVTAQRLTHPNGEPYAALSLVRDRTESKLIENTLRYIADTSLQLSGTELYISLISYLAKTLNVAYVFVGRYHPESKQVETLALCKDGQIVPNMTYSVVDTPCAEVVSEQRLVTCPYDLQKMFPDDFIAIEMNVESYVGLPLVSKSGKTLGVLSVMDRKPLENRYLAETLLHVTTQRAAREVEHEISQESLFTSNNRFRTLIDNTPAVIFVKDVNGVYLDVNQYTLQRFDLTYEQIIGHTSEDLFPGDLGKRMSTFDQEVVTTRKVVIFEQEFIERRGKRIDLVHKFPLLDASGEPYALCGIAIDITAQKQAQETMKEAEMLRLELENEKALQEFRVNFLSMITHDINNPIASVKLASNMLQEYWEQMDDSSRSARFESIFYNLSQISRLLEDILIIGEVESGHMPFHPVEQDIVAFCNDVIRDYLPTVELKHRLEYELPDKEAIVFFDPHLLNRAIGNLITNAVKYSPPKTTIRFLLSIEKNVVRICVQDQGIGIPQKDQAQLFQMFFRASNASTNTKGTGLGLAVVKYAADAHAGRVLIQSKVDEGSSFILMIPVRHPSARVVENQPADTALTTKPRGSAHDGA